MIRMYVRMIVQLNDEVFLSVWTMRQTVATHSYANVSELEDYLPNNPSVLLVSGFSRFLLYLILIPVALTLDPRNFTEIAVG